MVFEIPTDLNPQLVPLSWLIGNWQGQGIIEYENVTEQPFLQEIVFTSENTNFLFYRSKVWLTNQSGEKTQFLTMETGFWQLLKQQNESDVGPAFLPNTKPNFYTNAFEVEKLRNEAGNFELLVNLVQPGGVAELYLGTIEAAKIELTSDAILCSNSTKAYTAATRMYGLVEGDLLWVWDIAAFGKKLRSHASARLRKID